MFDGKFVLVKQSIYRLIGPRGFFIQLRNMYISKNKSSHYKQFNVDRVPTVPEISIKGTLM